MTIETLKTANFNQVREWASWAKDTQDRSIKRTYINFDQLVEIQVTILEWYRETDSSWDWFGKPVYGRRCHTFTFTA